MDDQTSTDTNIDMDTCIANSSNLPEQDHMDLNDGSPSVDHIIFVRDVIPYEIIQYPSDIFHGNEIIETTKISHIRRVQGVKTSSDKRYACVLPEIKVCFLLVLHILIDDTIVPLISTVHSCNFLCLYIFGEIISNIKAKFRYRIFSYICFFLKMSTSCNVLILTIPLSNHQI
jgi:hypothetical protein